MVEELSKSRGHGNDSVVLAGEAGSAVERV